MLRIAIAAQASYTAAGEHGPWFDDQQLLEALIARGHTAAIIAWEHPHDLQQYDAIYVSSTWNDCSDPPRFLEWLAACEQDGHSRLINDRAILELGFAKQRYWQVLTKLLEQHPAIAALGQLIPSRFFLQAAAAGSGFEAVDGRSLAEILAAADHDPLWRQANIVLKPTISADGINTFVYNRQQHTIPIDDAKRAEFVISEMSNANRTFQHLAADQHRQGVLLQPYMTGVEAGEYSLIFLGQQCTHAIQKPKLFKGDGSSRRRMVPLEQIPARMAAFSQQLVAALHATAGIGAISRLRLDLFDQGGIPMLCELECVSPNINLRVIAREDPSAAAQITERYAETIAARALALRHQAQHEI
ncbi:MAG: hypothetical protein Fur005_40300 [Roseiflexaceae bacterium]